MTTTGNGTTTAPLATFDDAYNFGSGSETLRDVSNQTAQEGLMLAATAAIENRCQRRLAPFTALVESQRAEGVDPDVLGTADMPMDTVSALGYSQAIAFASTNLVRDIWLDQFAPVRSDQWTYDIASIQLALAYGNTMVVDQNAIQGPEVDSGHIRLNLGTFCPIGTWVRTTYSGGYQTIPYDLWLACIFQAYKLALVGKGPETRKDVSMIDLDGEILALIAPYIRS